jgi:hypothetical protein
MSILPIITVTDLQRSTKHALESVKDYAVIRCHGKDVGLVLHPDLGKVLLESGVLRELIDKLAHGKNAGRKSDGRIDMQKLDGLIGNVILELSKQ